MEEEKLKKIVETVKKLADKYSTNKSSVYILSLDKPSFKFYGIKA